MSITRMKLFTYGLLVISLLVSVQLIKDILKLGQADERMKAVQTELNEAQIEQMNLKQSLEKVGTPDWQEATFRNTLNLSKHGEVVVIVPEAVRQTELIRPEVAAPETDLANWQKWWQVFAF